MDKITGQYLKFMSDIIDSGIWGELSSAAKTLYPVLLKFSDQNFKSVWPSTKTLLALTGFRSKKSIIEAKRELSNKGLIFFKTGSGRTNSTYFFSFHYREVSKNAPQGFNNVHSSGISKKDAGVKSESSLGYLVGDSNQINITINNNQPTVTKDDLKSIYGEEIYNKSIQNILRKGFKPTYEDINAECLNLCTSEEDLNDKAQHVIDSWRSFLKWSKNYLTLSSSNFFENLKIQADGSSIFIDENLNDFQKQIVIKYFDENVNPKIFVLFNNNHFSV